MSDKRSSLDIETKKQIIEFCLKNPKLSQDHIATHFSSIISRKISRSTISKILKNKEQILASDVSPQKKNMRTPKAPEMEKILFEWFDNAQLNLPISDGILKEKAQE